MDDAAILLLYRQRDQRAVDETSRKYGALCLKMAENLLGSRQDAEECLNDALLRLWESIPPAEPESLSAYLVTVCKHAALDRRRHQMREKRGGGQPALALDELSACIAAPEHPEEQFDRRALGEAIAAFLDAQPAEMRVMFILRYYYCLSVNEIAEECSAGVSKVKMSLLRTRNKLKTYLEQEGFV